MSKVIRADRMSSNCNLVIKEYEDVGRLLTDVTAENISLSGLSFKTKHKIESKDTLVIDMNFGDVCISDNIVKIKRVTRKDGFYYYGCKFVELNELENDNLRIEKYSKSVI